jgi:uncharacterized membrane protein YkvA (DUF1232 family)
MTTVAIIAAAVLAAYALALLALVGAGRRVEAKALARALPDLAVLVGRLLRDPRVPRRWKLALAGVGAYLAFPLDLVPDFIPVAGQLDDVILLVLVLRGVVRAAGPDVVRALAPPSLSPLLRDGRRTAPAAPPRAPRTPRAPDRGP